MLADVSRAQPEDQRHPLSAAFANLDVVVMTGLRHLLDSGPLVYREIRLHLQSYNASTTEMKAIPRHDLTCRTRRGPYSEQVSLGGKP
jgi:hypothetical protein